VCIEAKAAPHVSFESLSPDRTYLVICIDLDAPFISFSFLAPILHWLQSGLKASQDGSGTLQSSEPPISNYRGPGPPPGAAPHRYVFLLYEQPDDFNATKYAPAGGKEMGMGPRTRWNLDAWVKEAKLGPVLAVNYFTSN
jgi:phosphatidylethanolamine-binding protein (PEBP) family uncharacterized protein